MLTFEHERLSTAGRLFLATAMYEENESIAWQQIVDEESLLEFLYIAESYNRNLVSEEEALDLLYESENAIGLGEVEARECLADEVELAEKEASQFEFAFS